MATETTGGADPTGGASGNSSRAAFIPPGYGNMGSWYPYSGLLAQMQDAYNTWQKGAGIFAGNNSPVMSKIAGARPYVGGGLLGQTAYSGGPNPFLVGFSQPSSGFNPYLGRAIGGGAGGGAAGTGSGGIIPPGMIPPGSGPAGTPTIPGGFAPGSPMPRPGAPVAPGTMGRGGAPIMPGLLGAPNPFQQPGARSMGGAAPAPTGAGARSTGAAPVGTPGASAGGATLPYTPGSQFDPGSGNTSVASMLAYFNSLPDNQRGNFINAIDQYSLGKGGAANLGAALQQALRGQMGQQQFDNWYASNVTNKQGSGIGREGLPQWLLSALGG